ncbi:Yin/yang transcription factor [Parasponia andersonii]|uniref:Yin/yang transcription factor n=1 Tax=Parasponia andersonii TaxID=3476 RepID=A0A2P5CNH7_PARAD|nr:Yin/yang transcription factor [Parasponia andersonii]
MAESSGHHIYELLDSKSSSDETITDRSDQNDETGPVVVAGRSYECVFCKRGFTTAQALGGHMNIHRKNRGPKATRLHCNIDPTLAASSKLGEENYATTFRSFLAIQSYPPLQYLANKATEGIHVNFQTYNFPAVAATWSSDNMGRVPPPDQVSRDDDPREYLSLGIGVASREKEEEEGIDDEEILEKNNNEEKISGLDYNEDVELDLELRLGYDP